MTETDYLYAYFLEKSSSEKRKRKKKQDAGVQKGVKQKAGGQVK